MVVAVTLIDAELIFPPPIETDPLPGWNSKLEGVDRSRVSLGPLAKSL